MSSATISKAGQWLVWHARKNNWTLAAMLDRAEFQGITDSEAELITAFHGNRPYQPRTAKLPQRVYSAKPVVELTKGEKALNALHAAAAVLDSTLLTEYAIKVEAMLEAEAQEAEAAILQAQAEALMAKILQAQKSLELALA